MGYVGCRASRVRAARGAARGDCSAGTGDRRVVFLPIRIRAFGVRLRIVLMRFGVRAVALAAAVADRIGTAKRTMRLGFFCRLPRAEVPLRIRECLGLFQLRTVCQKATLGASGR